MSSNINDIVERVLLLVNKVSLKASKNPEKVAKILRELAKTLYEESMRRKEPYEQVILERLAEKILRLADKYSMYSLNRGELDRIDEVYRSSKKDIPTNLSELIVVEKPSVKLSDLADLEEAKESLIESLIPIFRPDIAKVGWKAILLVGPPGTGKTTLAKAVAGELNITFIYFDIPSILSKWFGETEKNIKGIFKLARSHAPSMLFIDEIDALKPPSQDSSGVMMRVDRVLRTELEGFLTTDKRVVVLAATNYPWEITLPLLSRFERKIVVPLPDKETRKKIFEIHIKKLGLEIGEDVDLDKLAELTKGYSGREIVQLVKYMYLGPIRKLVKKYGTKILYDKSIKPEIKITMNDFLEGIKKIKPAVSPTYLAKLKAWLQQQGLNSIVEPKD